MKLFAGAAVGALVLGLSAHAGAAPLTFSISSTGSGAFDGVAFSNALITLDGTGDTSNISNPETGLYEITDVKAGVTVAGLGTDTVTDDLHLNFSTLYLNLGVGDDATDNFFGLDVLANFDLSTSTGPVTGYSRINPFSFFNTTKGALSITSTSSETTYQATIAGVPEPSAWALLIAGFGFAGGVARRRRRGGFDLGQGVA